MNNDIVWKDIPSYEGLYQVNNLGEVKSLRENKLMKQTLQVQEKENYKRYVVTLIDKEGKKKHHKVHRLVAQAFIPNPENKPQVNHIDGNPTNNCLTNLEWCTSRENVKHSYKYLRKKRYNEESILEKIRNNVTPKEIIESEHISRPTYYSICKKHNIKTKGVKYWNSRYHIDLDELLDDFKKGIKNEKLVDKYKCSNCIIATKKYQFKKEGLL